MNTYELVSSANSHLQQGFMSLLRNLSSQALNTFKDADSTSSPGNLRQYLTMSGVKTTTTTNFKKIKSECTSSSHVARDRNIISPYPSPSLTHQVLSTSPHALHASARASWWLCTGLVPVYQSLSCTRESQTGCTT